MGKASCFLLVLWAACASGLALGVPAVRPASAHHRALAPVMWGSSSNDAREADFQRRQERLKQRKAAAAAAPKGQVTVSFPQKGGKQVTAQQGEALGKVISRAGVRVKFDCKNGRCGTCQVSINGRSKAKICQGPKVPAGATKSLSITLDNP